ncbi:hypothetical protein D3C72_1852580 [compost metagenome]
MIDNGLDAGGQAAVDRLFVVVFGRALEADGNGDGVAVTDFQLPTHLLAVILAGQVEVQRVDQVAIGGKHLA